jgi:hypothetical protein
VQLKLKLKFKDWPRPIKDGEPTPLNVTHIAAERLELQFPFAPLFDFPTRTLYALLFPSDMLKPEKELMSWPLGNNVNDQLCAVAGAPLTFVMV